MPDLSRGHVVFYALLCLALFAALFTGVVQVHKRAMLRQATASYAPAAQQAVPNN